MLYPLALYLNDSGEVRQPLENERPGLAAVVKKCIGCPPEKEVRDTQLRCPLMIVKRGEVLRNRARNGSRVCLAHVAYVLQYCVPPLAQYFRSATSAKVVIIVPYEEAAEWYRTKIAEWCWNSDLRADNGPNVVTLADAKSLTAEVVIFDFVCRRAAHHVDLGEINRKEPFDNALTCATEVRLTVIGPCEGYLVEKRVQENPVLRFLCEAKSSNLHWELNVKEVHPKPDHLDSMGFVNPILDWSDEEEE